MVISVDYDFLDPVSIVGLDVNDPGDARFLDEVMSLRALPKCAGYDEAVVNEVVVRGLRGDVFRVDKITCPDVCPRDVKSVKSRCMLRYV